MGNICRSPTAEAVFRKHVTDAGLSGQVYVDSAGTGDWHAGSPPDQRACQAAAKRGYNLDPLRARQVTRADFESFDLILAMDQDNLVRLQKLRSRESTAELDLFLRRYRLSKEEVPDPYFGNVDGFEEVLDLIEQASIHLLGELKARL